MSNYNVTVVGKEQLIANLKKISNDIRGEAALRAVNAGGIQIENQAKINAPVLTGALRNSASTEAKNIPNGAVAEIGFRGLAYAKIQEFGGYAGRNHAAHITGKRYLGKAIEQTQITVYDVMSSVIEGYLKVN